MFQRCSPTRVFEDVAEQIRRAIVSGELQPGERLPPQRQLADTFGVGRSTLLAALRVLEKSGLIVIRPGAKGGAYVTVPSIEQVSEALDLFLQRQGTTVQDLAEFRQEIEGAAVARAAQRATDAEARSLVALVAELEQLHRQGRPGWARFLAKELQLHRALVDLGHNTVSSAVLTAINATMERAFESLPYGHGDRVVEDWRAIALAIHEHRGPDAEAALHAHIAYFTDVAMGETQRQEPVAAV